MNDPIVIDRSTLNALLAVVEKEATRAHKLATFTTDKEVKTIHLEAAKQLEILSQITTSEYRSLITATDDRGLPHDFIDSDPDGQS